MPAKQTSRRPARKTTANSKRPAKKAAKSAVKVTRRATATAASDRAGTGRGDWREAALAEVRTMISDADPEIIEERKWFKPSNPGGVPVWSRGAIICTGETYKQAVKLTFMNGASLPDPRGLFNSSLDGGTRRAIDIREGDKIDKPAFKKLVRAAVARNLAKKN